MNNRSRKSVKLFIGEILAVFTMKLDAVKISFHETNITYLRRRSVLFLNIHLE